ncbi:MAG TPA: hypothetical protein VMV49_11560 [Candidatus Deferrimicrobium sp.]|nr:hypothetical protein [Candidatus Deferrimicrobium sp.]
MEGHLLLILLVLGLVIIGTIISLLYYIFVQKPETKRELKINRKKILDFLQKTPITRIEIDKIADATDIEEEYTVQDVLLDLIRENKLNGLLLFPDVYFNLQYCKDQIYSFVKKQSDNAIPLKLLVKEFDTTHNNVQKILIELLANQWIYGHYDSTKDVFILQSEMIERKQLTCPFCNGELPSLDIENCPHCKVDLNRCGVCNLIIGKEETLSCPFCDQPSHADHLLEWVKIKGSCSACGHELHDFELT